MLSILSANWWVIALRGVVAVLFGIIAWVWPNIALEALIILFGVFALVDGISSIFAAFLAPGPAGSRWLLGLAGAAGVAAGIIAFARPDLTAQALLYVIAAWAIVTGIFEIAAGISFSNNAGSVLLWVLAGIASIVFGGLLLIMDPSDGILALTWLVGVYAITYGVLEIVFAFMLRGLGEEIGRATDGRSRPAGRPA
jgi:uncharacterized membrane protein HdeD (DUF308 family)